MSFHTSHPYPKVLHITSGDLWAGAEVQLFTLAKTLQNRFNVPISVVLFNHGELEQRLLKENVKIIILDESKLNGLQIMRRLISIIRDLKPDVVHTHRSKENILGGVSALLAGGIPSMRTTHGAPEHRPDWWHFPKRAIRFLDWLIGRYLQKKIIAVSDDLAETLKNHFPAEKVSVIENGIDLDVILKSTPGRQSKHHNASDTYKIGIAGRLTRVKRIDIFLSAARYVLDHHPELATSYLIFGDGPLRNELQSLNSLLAVDDIVRFEGHCANIHQRIRELDVLLITSDHEGLPMVVLEAMALQVPVIAHAVGGIPKVLDYGSCGILITGQSESDFGNAIYSLATSPRMQAEIRKNALDRVTRHYSAENNGFQYASTYSGLSDN